MGSFRWRDLIKALKKKGFVLDRSTSHLIYFLVVGGQDTGIRVPVGNHSADLGIDLQTRIARQLLMPDRRFLADFVACTRSLDDYVAHLRSSGYLD